MVWQNNKEAIIGGSVGALVLIVVISVGCYLWKRKQEENGRVGDLVGLNVGFNNSNGLYVGNEIIVRDDSNQYMNRGYPQQSQYSHLV